MIVRPANRDQVIALVWPVISNGDPDPDDRAAAEDVADALLEAFILVPRPRR